MEYEYVPIYGVVGAIIKIREAIDGDITIPMEPCVSSNCTDFDKTGKTVCKYEDGLIGGTECPKQKGRLSIKIASLNGENITDRDIKFVCLEPVKSQSLNRIRNGRRRHSPYFI